jgi:hypothetical protein
MNGRFHATPSATMGVNRSRSGALVVSAFDTLLSTPPEIIDAMTLSVPVKNNDEAAALQEFALELAEEYNMRAEMAVDHGHVVVRVTRRQTRQKTQPIA